MHNAHSTTDDPHIAYSSDAVYLYSTHDDSSDGASGKDTLIASNHTSPERSSRSSAVRSTISDPADIRRTDTEMEEDIERVMTEDGDEYNYMDENADEDENGDSETDDVSVGFEIEDVPTMKTSTVPIVYPRARFSGACNVETVKDGASCAFLYCRFPCSACLQSTSSGLKMNMLCRGRTTATFSSGGKTLVSCMTSWKGMVALSTSSKVIHSNLSLL